MEASSTRQSSLVPAADVVQRLAYLIASTPTKGDEEARMLFHYWIQHSSEQSITKSSEEYVLNLLKSISHVHQLSIRHDWSAVQEEFRDWVKLKSEVVTQITLDLACEHGLSELSWQLMHAFPSLSLCTRHFRLAVGSQHPEMVDFMLDNFSARFTGILIHLASSSHANSPYWTRVRQTSLFRYCAVTSEVMLQEFQGRDNSLANKEESSQDFLHDIKIHRLWMIKHLLASLTEYHTKGTFIDEETLWAAAKSDMPELVRILVEAGGKMHWMESSKGHITPNTIATAINASSRSDNVATVLPDEASSLFAAFGGTWMNNNVDASVGEQNHQQDQGSLTGLLKEAREANELRRAMSKSASSSGLANAHTIPSKNLNNNVHENAVLPYRMTKARSVINQRDEGWMKYLMLDPAPSENGKPGLEEMIVPVILSADSQPGHKDEGLSWMEPAASPGSAESRSPAFSTSTVTMSRTNTIGSSENCKSQDSDDQLTFYLGLGGNIGEQQACP